MAVRRSISGREVLVSVPESEPRALVLSLHGTTSTARQQLRYTGMEALPGAVVAYPQGSVPSRSGYMWDQRADLDHLAEVIAELRQEFSLPRACVCGMSGGARMACAYASVRSEDVLVVGAVAGLRAPGATPPSPVPILAFHGTDDRINPYGGSRNERWDESVPESALAWARVNGTEASRTDVVVGAELSRTTFGPEGGPGEVTLWTIARGGHTWPGAVSRPLLRMFLGRTSKAINATEHLWAFYEDRL